MKGKNTAINHLCLWFLTAVRRLWWAVLTQCWVVVLVLLHLVYLWVDFCPLVVSCLELFLPCSLQLQQVNLSVNLSLHGQMFISNFEKFSVATVDIKMFVVPAGGPFGLNNSPGLRPLNLLQVRELLYLKYWHLRRWFYLSLPFMFVFPFLSAPHRTTDF